MRILSDAPPDWSWFAPSITAAGAALTALIGAISVALWRRSATQHAAWRCVAGLARLATRTPQAAP